MFIYVCVSIIVIVIIVILFTVFGPIFLGFLPLVGSFGYFNFLLYLSTNEVRPPPTYIHNIIIGSLHFLLHQWCLVISWRNTALISKLLQKTWSDLLPPDMFTHCVVVVVVIILEMTCLLTFSNEFLKCARLQTSHASLHVKLNFWCQFSLESHPNCLRVLKCCV